MFLSSSPHPNFVQALKKIHLVNHIKSMVELLHADTVEQSEMTCLGSPVAHIIDLLSTGVMQPVLTSHGTVAHFPKVYTTTLIAPPPSTIPIIGITDSLPIRSVSSGDSGVTSDPQEIPKCHHIMPTLIQPSESAPLPSSPPSPGPSSKSTSYPTLVVPELSIPTEAQPKWLNQPGGSKEYCCQLCTFCHTNQDCMLTHI